MPPKVAITAVMGKLIALATSERRQNLDAKTGFALMASLSNRRAASLLPFVFGVVGAVSPTKRSLSNFPAGSKTGSTSAF